MAALSPAHVFELVKKLSLLHQEAVDERGGRKCSLLGFPSALKKKICNTWAKPEETLLLPYARYLRLTELQIHYKPLFVLVFKTS